MDEAHEWKDESADVEVSVEIFFDEKDDPWSDEQHGEEDKLEE